MRRIFKRALSLMLAASMIVTNADITALAASQDNTSEEVIIITDDTGVSTQITEEELKDKLEEGADKTTYPGGVFGFYETILNANEGDERTIRVVRQGNTEKEASVVFKAVDISAEYGKDYTLTVDGGIFGEKELPAADDVRPLLEEYGEAATTDEVAAIMETKINEPADDTTNMADTDPVVSDASDASAVSDDSVVSDASELSDNLMTPGGDSSLANLYSLQTGEEAPEYDWTEYNEETAPEDTIDAMRSGWDESKENLQSLPGVTVKLTFSPGEYKKDIKVKVKDDNRSESDEVMIFVLQEAEGAEIGDSYNGYLNISDNDDTEEISYSVKERELTITPDQDTAIVTVVRNSGIDQMDFVAVGTQGIDAVADTDYVRTFRELFFAAGVTEKTIEVPIISDRDIETHFWIGVRNKNGTVSEDSACLVTIKASDIQPGDADHGDSFAAGTDPEEVVSSSEAEDGVKYDSVAADNGVDALSASNDEKYYEVTVYDWERDPNRTGEFCGSAWRKVSDNIDLRSADYVRVEYDVWGYERHHFLGIQTSIGREKISTIGLYKSDGRTAIKPDISHSCTSSSDHFNEATQLNDYFRRGDDEEWNLTNVQFWARVEGGSGISNGTNARIMIRHVYVGYREYKLSISNTYNNTNQYSEKIYTSAAVNGYSSGNIVTYPEAYFTDGAGKSVNEKIARSGETVSIATAAQGKNPNSQGVYANSDTVSLKGYKLYDPQKRALTEDILQSGFTIDNSFKIKYKDCIQKVDGENLIELIPVYEPKEVLVTFCNEAAVVSGKADVKGSYDGFASDYVLKATALDSLDVKSKANQSYGVTEMVIQTYKAVKNSTSKWNGYTTVNSNISQGSEYEFKTGLNYLGYKWNSGLTKSQWDKDLRVYISYDRASITVAPDPTADTEDMDKNGSILYVDENIKAGTDQKTGKIAEGGQSFKIDDVSIGKAYTLGSLVDSKNGYHTFWTDGTLDRDGDGITNETHPTYKSFDPFIGQSMKYVTKLPLSRIYYTFATSFVSKKGMKPVPIRGWLKLRDRFLISGHSYEKGLNNITVFSDDVETKTGFGSFDTESGDGYFELTSPNFFKIYNFGVTFTGETPAGNVAAMTTMYPGKNEVICIDAWNDVDVQDVKVYKYSQVKKNNQPVKDKDGNLKYEYLAMDTSSAKGTDDGYYTGITDGDYKYRIQMTAKRDGLNITDGELSFYDKTTGGILTTIEGVPDENNSGMFTFDFNPKEKGIKPGATAKVTFSSGDVTFLAREVGIKVRASMSEVTIINFLSGGNVENARIDIIGAVNSAINMGWKGGFDDSIDATSDTYVDEYGNMVVKVGIGTNKLVSKQSVDEMTKASKAASAASEAVGKKNKEIANYKKQIANASGDKKAELEKSLSEAETKLTELNESADKAKKTLNDKLDAKKEPKKEKPKFGTSFKMDLGFSFLMSFGYDDDQDKYYFKNLTLTASLTSGFKVTMTYATPVGVTLGIALTLGLDGSASFIIEQTDASKADPSKRYYIAQGESLSVFDLKFDGKGTEIPYKKSGLFSVNPSIGLELSAGVAGGLLKVTVSGNAYFNMVFGTDSDSAGTCTLTASITIHALVFDFKKEFANKTYTLWGDEDIINTGALTGSVMQALDGSNDNYLYESIDSFTAQDVSYMADEVVWFGGDTEDGSESMAVDVNGDAITNLKSLDESGTDAYAESTLANKIGSNADFDMVSLGNGRFAAVFLSVPVNRVKDPDNASAAYYTYYDGSSWSTPVILEDDGTLDYYPHIYSMGDGGAFVIWSSVNEAYKDTEDKIERQNALDLHGVFVKADGSLDGDVREITRSVTDDDAENTGYEISDFSADRAIGLFLKDDKLVVCYEKRQYAAQGNTSVNEDRDANGATVGDMMYPVSSVLASRSLDLKTDTWADSNETLRSLPALKAFGDAAEDRVEAYNEAVYGQKFGNYIPGVMLYEDIDYDTTDYPAGYYRQGGDGTTAAKIDNASSALLLDCDAVTYSSADKDYNVLAYTLDTDGDMNTLTDRELYIMTYDVTEDTFSEPIIITGQEINRERQIENKNPRFIDTYNGILLSWLKGEDIVALDITYLLDNADTLVKTASIDGITYRYVDKNYETADGAAGYNPPVSIVTGRIAEEVEGSEERIVGNIQSFDAHTDGIYVYFIWPEASEKQEDDDKDALSDTQMWCARAEVKDVPGYPEIISITSPVQITSHYGNHYDDVDFGVYEGNMYGLARKVPSRYITESEAKQIHGEDVAYTPYEIWDDASAYPVSFRVDPTSVARIKSAGFSEAQAGVGAAFSFDILNDGFDELTEAVVTATDTEGNNLLRQHPDDAGDGDDSDVSVDHINIQSINGGDRERFSGYLPLNDDATEATVTITVTTADGKSLSKTITETLEADVVVNNMSVDETGVRNVYHVTGTVENYGNARSDAGYVTLFAKKGDEDRKITKLQYPELMPGQTYDIDTDITVADEDFTSSVVMVNTDTGEIVDEYTTGENIAYSVTEELQLYAGYTAGMENIDIPVYQPQVSTDETEETDEIADGVFITRKVYALEIAQIDAVTGVNVNARVPVEETDDDGKVSVTGAKTVSSGSGFITLELGERAAIDVDILSKFAGDEVAVDDNDNVIYRSTGAEGLTYSCEYIGDNAELNDEGYLSVLKPGSGKLKVYVYPDDRVYATSNSIAGDQGVDTSGTDGLAPEMFGFTQLENGEHEDTYYQCAAAAIKTFIIDVDTVEAGTRIADAENAYFEDKGIRYRISGTGEAAVCGLGETAAETAKVVIPATVKNNGVAYKVTRIDANAFAGNTAIKTVNIGNNVSLIKSSAFENCTSLTEVKFGSGVTEIDENAFAGCISLTGIKLPAKLVTIGDGAFKYCAHITSVTLPQTLEKLGDKAFTNCAGLKSITINSDKLSAKNIGRDPFAGIPADAEFNLNIKDAAVKEAISGILTEEMETFTNKKGIRFRVRSASDKTLAVAGLREDAANKLKSVSIPKSVKYKGYDYTVIAVDDGAFAGNTKLTKVTLPKTVTSIGAEAFKDMTALKSMVIPASVGWIGDEAYSGCNALMKVNIASGNVRLGENVFEGVPDYAAFKYNVKFAEVEEHFMELFLEDDLCFTSKDGINYITLGKAAIVAGCEDPAISKLNIPATIQYRGITLNILAIDDRSFAGFKNLKTVSIGKNATMIGDEVFKDCTSLKSVSMKGAENIGDGTFEGCTSLKSISIPKGAKYIGDRAFAGCTGFTKVTIPENVRGIGAEAFAECSALKSVNIKSAVLTIVDVDAFKDIAADAVYKISVKAKTDEYKKMLVDCGVNENAIR